MKTSLIYTNFQILMQFPINYNSKKSKKLFKIKKTL